MAKTSEKRVPTPSRPPASRRSVPPPAPTRSSVRPPAPAAAANPRRRSRGTAPWAARHAAKHAAEAAARNQEPPRPGSARATLREPDQAESLKARITELHEQLSQLRALKKTVPTRFLEVGNLLRHIRDARLFEAKGYASFEAFVERELDLGGKTLVLRLARIPEIFREDAAKELGLDALLAAVEILEQAAQRPPALRPPALSRR